MCNPLALRFYRELRPLVGGRLIRHDRLDLVMRISPPARTVIRGWRCSGISRPNAMSSLSPSITMILKGFGTHGKRFSPRVARRADRIVAISDAVEVHVRSGLASSTANVQTIILRDECAQADLRPEITHAGGLVWKESSGVCGCRSSQSVRGADSSRRTERTSARDSWLRHISRKPLFRR